jgi:integrase/recombinase XerD
MTVDTYPRGEADKNKNLYIYFYDPAVKYTRRKATKWKNTKEGRAEARRFIKQLQTLNNDERMIEAFKNRIKRAPLITDEFKNFIGARTREANSNSVYNHAFNHFTTACSIQRIDRYTIEHGLKYIQHLQNAGLSVNTIHTYTKHMHIIWKYFVQKKYSRNNIIKIIDEEQKPVRVIPNDHLKIIFDEFKKNNPEHYFTFKFLYYTGMRISSFLLLNWNDILIEQKIIYYRNKKGKRNSVFPVHQLLADLLDEHKAIRTGPVSLITTRNGIYSAWKRTVRAPDKLNMNYTVHQLRKTFGSALSMDGVNIKDVQELLDHSDEKTTKKFYRIAQTDRLRKEIDKANLIK